MSPDCKKLGAGKSTGKKLLEKPRRRWEVIIRIDLKNIGVNTSNWIYLGQDADYRKALVNAVLNLQVS